MALTTQLGKQLCKKCQLDMERETLRQRKQALEDALPQAKFDFREASAALVEYEGGGLGIWLDKLSGKWEEKRQTLARRAKASESALHALQRDLAQAEAALEELEAQEQQLAFTGTLREAAQELEPREREVIFRMGARVLTVRLLPLLDTAKNALEEAQEWARPNNRIDTAPGYTKGILLARAEQCARECAQNLLELKDWGIELQGHPYFENPAGFIHGVASQFKELDRINSALKGIYQMQNQVKQLQLQLTEEDEV